MCSTYPSGIDETTALVVLVVNILFPGIGTIIAGLLGSTSQCATVMIGILQLLLVPVLLIGWIWSIIWSITLFKKSKMQDGGGKVNMQNEQVQHNEQQQNQNHHHHQQQHPPPPPPQMQQPPPVYAQQPAAYPTAPPPPVPPPPPTKPYV